MALPANPAAVASYLAALADEGRSTSTVRVARAAIAWKHHGARAPDPTIHTVVAVSRVTAAARFVAKRDPLTTDDVAAIIGDRDHAAAQRRIHRAGRETRRSRQG